MQILHNNYAETSCTIHTILGVCRLVCQQANEHDRHVGSQRGGKQVAWPPVTVDGTESGLAFVEHTAGGPSALNPR